MRDLGALRSFPTRRSSDLSEGPLSVDTASAGAIVLKGKDLESLPEDPDELAAALSALAGPDRKSTRLNSSHLVISYAVFCLKKKRGCWHRTGLQFSAR